MNTAEKLEAFEDPGFAAAPTFHHAGRDMSDQAITMLTAAEAAEVTAFINSPSHRAWERKVLARWNIDPGAIRQGIEAKAKRRISRRHIAAVQRYASQRQRTPPWADKIAIKAIYAEARLISRITGIPHHVDHEIPLQGRLVSGLHVHNNLQILTGSENSKKRNRFEI